MSYVISSTGFGQAKALLADQIFFLTHDMGNPEFNVIAQLFQAREKNSDFEYALAEMVCGEANTSFPYRSSYYLTKFFQDLGFKFTHDGSTRRFWVKEVLLQMTTSQLSIIIQNGLFNKHDFQEAARKNGSDWRAPYSSAIAEFKNLISDSTIEKNTVSIENLFELDHHVEMVAKGIQRTADQDLNQLIQEATQRFLLDNDKLIALEKIWDAFERIKTYFDNDKKKSSAKLVELSAGSFDFNLINDEFIRLTKLGNEFRIRHHEKGKREISELRHINYIFFRMLSLLDLCIKSLPT